jgi:hypothetical protein
MELRCSILQDTLGTDAYAHLPRDVNSGFRTYDQYCIDSIASYTIPPDVFCFLLGCLVVLCAVDHHDEISLPKQHHVPPTYFVDQ